MFTGGYFINKKGIGSGSSHGGHEDVYIEDGDIIFSPVDPIYIDENQNVFFSKGNNNAYMYADNNGKVFVKEVSNG